MPLTQRLFQSRKAVDRPRSILTTLVHPLSQQQQIRFFHDRRLRVNLHDTA
jgi:hypothetical protein